MASRLLYDELRFYMVLGSAGIFGGNERSAAIAPAKIAPVRHPVPKTESPFAPALKQAIHSARAVSQKAAASVKIPPARDTVSSSLNLVNGLPPVSTPASNPAPAATTTPAAANPGPTVIDTLKAALVQAGVDISSMQFTEHRDLVTYPGGSYINDIISLQAPNGRTHEYMTDLVALSPQVTVNEIQQLMAGNRG